MIITDEAGNFEDSGIKKGDIVHNMTDDVYSVVESVESATTLKIRKPTFIDLLWFRFKYWIGQKYQKIKTFLKRIKNGFNGKKST